MVFGMIAQSNLRYSNKLNSYIIAIFQSLWQSRVELANKYLFGPHGLGSAERPCPHAISQRVDVFQSATS
jgi:hypothetical protein